jgi:RNA polymerase sigma-70 factor (ECF subfamily)
MNGAALALTTPRTVTGQARRETASAPLQPDEALRQLMDQWEAPIYRFLVSLLHDRDLAQDCAQDTFIRAYRTLTAGKNVTGSWLFTVARNRAVDEFRRQRRVHPDLEAIEHESTRDDPDQKVLVDQVMAQLPPLDREVLYLFAVAGFKTDEIGAMLGVRGTAVRQRLYRARERARSLWEDAA